jgi:hypothetical protein
VTAEVICGALLGSPFKKSEATLRTLHQTIGSTALSQVPKNELRFWESIANARLPALMSSPLALLSAKQHDVSFPSETSSFREVARFLPQDIVKASSRVRSRDGTLLSSLT